MKFQRIFAMSLLLSLFHILSIQAQCETWVGSPKEEEATNAHVVYRPFVKDKEQDEIDAMSDADFKIAFDNWKKAYEIAPAADGERNFHFTDGRMLYQALYNKTDDEAKKKEYAQKILDLYDQEIKCFGDEAYNLGLKGFDMFFYLGYGFDKKVYDVLKESIDKGGNASGYYLYDPIAQLLTELYQNKELTKDDVTQMVDKLDAIAEYNIKNNPDEAQDYKDAVDNLEAYLQPIEDEVFDCAYFKKKLIPEYKAKPDDIKTLEYVYLKLKERGCDPNEPIMQELSAKYKVVAEKINAELSAKKRLEDPMYDAIELQKEGKYDQAIKRYNEAIEEATDNDAKAQAYYSIGSILLWQKGQYQSARAKAKKAASLKPGWGKPYLLIADIYGKASRGCGDSWNQRLAMLAALEKAYYAKKIDPSIADEANKRISIFSKGKPLQDEGFMRGVKEGQKAKVGCWIGETVTIQFQK